MSVRCPACSQAVTVPQAPAAENAGANAAAGYSFQGNSGLQWSDQANVSVWTSGGIGIGLTGKF